MIRKVIYLFYVLIILLPISLIAKNNIITGRITDNKTNDPLHGANITIVGTSMGSATDDNGNYTLKNVPPGNYTLKATFIGYKTEEKKN